jgi:hypothetical protein
LNRAPWAARSDEGVMSIDPSQLWTLAIVCIVCVALIICSALYWDFRKRQLIFEERRVAIENGMPPPPLPQQQLGGWPGVRQRELELKAEERRLMIERGIPVQEEQKKPLTRQDCLRRGLLATGVGVGALLAYVLLGVEQLQVGGLEDARAWCAGLGPVLLFYGIGHLVYQRFITDPPPATVETRS